MGLVGIVPMANPTGGGRIQGDSWDNFIVRMDRARASVNDSVLSVKTVELDEAVPVYDVEVEGCHNFGVRSDAARNGDSIIVHNSEYLFLDDTACNLASIRLTKFLPLDDDDLARFEHVVRLWTVVLEISVYMASFPSEAIARNTYLYRTLGLGYADLGGLLMRLAIPYASDEGRALAAGLTALMTGAAYRTSAEMAEEIGPFPRWDANEECMRRVLRNHARATGNWVGGEGYEDLTIEPRRELINLCSYDLLNRIRRAWSIVMSAELFRNAQVTVMAPTGTISFVMDCDTTGVEPDFALVKHKQLAGGGSMRIVNQAVPEALGRLGYQGDVIEKILRLVDETGRPDHYLDGQHLGIFACAGDISPEDHVRMVAAVQPLLSGGASKTINMPRDATVDDVDQMLRLAASLGVKSIAVYRDGSKLSQPLSASYDKSADLLSNREAVFRSISPHPISNPGDGGELWQPRAIDQSKGPADTRPVVSERLADDMKRFGMSTDNVVVAPSQLPVSLARGEREYLPWRRDRGFTQKIKIGENRQSVFLRVSEYPDGRPGEVFLEIAGEGSTLRALANCLAISISVGLQRGVPVAEYVDQFVGTKFEPAGYVEGHDRIRFASSIVDYIGRELGIAYDGRDDLANSPAPIAETIERIADASERADEEWRSVIDPRLVAHVRVPSWQPTGDACPMCGSLLRRAGTCRSCPNCEYDEGCSG